MFKGVNPLLGVRDLERALEFYVGQLGFHSTFRDPSQPDNYAGVRRDRVELHMQWQGEHEMGTCRLCFYVEDPDALFAEYRASRALSFTPDAEISDTPWGTREFWIYDPDGNALTFYRDL